MQPIGFEVLGVPGTMYTRFVRYHYWWRHHPLLIASGIVAILAGLAYIAVICIDLGYTLKWPFWLFYMGIIIFTSIPNGLYARRQRFLAMRWEYTFWEGEVVARTHETYQSWKYSSLDYAREAKDAFYLVLNAKSNEAMVIPKEDLTPEQCAALAEILQKGVPEGKFTRAEPKTRRRPNGNAIAMCVFAAVALIMAGVAATSILPYRRQADVSPPGHTLPAREPPYEALAKAEAGDRVHFGYRGWVVLDREPDAILLILEDEIYLRGEEPEEVRTELNVVADYGDQVGLGEFIFPHAEFDLIRRMPDRVFLLTGEQKEQYGIGPPKLGSYALTPARPAMWVSIK